MAWSSASRVLVAAALSATVPCCDEGPLRPAAVTVDVRATPFIPGGHISFAWTDLDTTVKETAGGSCVLESVTTWWQGASGIPPVPGADAWKVPGGAIGPYGTLTFGTYRAGYHWTEIGAEGACRDATGRVSTARAVHHAPLPASLSRTTRTGPGTP